MSSQPNYRQQIEKKFNCRKIIGNSIPLCKALNLAHKVATTNTTVLINGHSGTGKELISHAIHDNSARSAKIFLPVNCAAIPHNLLEAELFGYEAGAFTGANKLKKGKFELAAGGTLFLDEIGDMNFDIQAKLLRVLEEHCFQRLGGTDFIDVDLRIIAATNKNLKQMIRQGKFREDLFFRLNVFPIQMPPLKERGEDVILLAQHFIRQFSHELGKTPPVLNEKAKARLRESHWKGNIRELKNTIERSIILSKGRKIIADHIIINDGDAEEIYVEPEIEKFIAFLLKDHDFNLAKLEARILYHAVRAANFNVSKASKMLGLSRPTLRYRLEKHQNFISQFQNLDNSSPYPV